MSIFLDFNLPNSTTWFYFSFLLSVALFFKFGRLISIRNWDLLTLFLLVPGLLLVQSARPVEPAVPDLTALQLASWAGQAGGGMPAVLGGFSAFAPRGAAAAEAQLWLRAGYLWLIGGSLYFFCRCLLDLSLVQRPALPPNLNFGGLAWLAGALIVCLMAVAYRQNERSLALNARSGERGGERGGAPSTPGAATAVDGDPARAIARGWLMPGATMLAHLVVVLGLLLVGRIHFQDAPTGMAAAACYLLLPYTGMMVSQLVHVLPMAILIWALVAFRQPSVAGGVMGAAIAVSFFPVLLVPVWVSFYRGRGAGRFLFFCTLTAAAGTFGLYSLGEPMRGLWPLAFNQPAWQAWRIPSAESFWAGVHWAYRIPVFIAYLGFVLATLFWPNPKNLGHLLALSTAVIVGVQLWLGDQGGSFVLWYMPLLLLMVFRPNVQDLAATPLAPDSDWLYVLRQRLRRFVRWIGRIPEPAVAK